MTDSLTEPDELPNQLSAVDQRVAQELRQRNHNLWRSNYHEASIYIEEGLNNDKFENHPRKRARKALSSSPPSSSTALCPTDSDSATDSALPKEKLHDAGEKRHGFILGGQYTTIETYILVHNRYFYQLDLAASIVLLLLALVEPPAIDGYELNPKIHAAIELFALGIIAVELLLKFRWMGPGRFFRHGRTVTKLIVLLAMNLEAVFILLRHSTHPRYSRALRPIFLMDNHYCHGLRRAVRQIFQSLPPIIDMFTLALFFMFIFSIFGFYMFASNNYYFSDMPATIGNLLILATTANLPDVMMPSYAVSRWSAVFFVLFVIIHLFLFTNLTMAAVYEIFTRKEKEKFHKLLLHRRKACQEAFKLLVSRRQPNRIQYRQFMGLMRYLNRKCSMFDAYLIFKALDTDQNGGISLSEFYQIYDFINLEWKLIYPQFKWYDDYTFLPKMVKSSLRLIERVCKHRVFEWIIDLLIGAQALLQFVEATTLGHTAPAAGESLSIPTDINSTQLSSNQSLTSTTINLGAQAIYRDNIYPDKISTHIFISVFCAELVLRILADGARDYWRNKWNRFDVIVLATSLVGLINGLAGGHPFGWVVVLRVLRLMRLFEFKRRYRDMWQTLTYILLKRFVSMTCVVMILYYFFSIIGMELLGHYDLRNCCKNTTLESQFRFEANSSTLDDGFMRYYLNDFGDLVASYLTLFSMSSNTYWLTLMSAYTIVSGTNWVRLYFGLYYLCSIIVMNIVIAFILESFLFHIHYRNKMGKDCDETNLFTVSVTLSSFEVDFLRENLGQSLSVGRGPSGSAATQNGRLCVQKLNKTVEKVRRGMQEKRSRKSFPSGTTSDSKSEPLIPSEDCGSYGVDERTSLLKNDRHDDRPLDRPKRRVTIDKRPRFRDIQLIDVKSASTTLEPEPGSQTNGKPKLLSGNSSSPPVNCMRRPEYYLIYQAEQIRNKFSFTMKMYAEEVDNWLAEAERAESVNVNKTRGKSFTFSSRTNPLPTWCTNEPASEI